MIMILSVYGTIVLRQNWSSNLYTIVLLMCFPVFIFTLVFRCFIFYNRIMSSTQIPAGMHYSSLLQGEPMWDLAWTLPASPVSMPRPVLDPR